MKRLVYAFARPGSKRQFTDQPFALSAGPAVGEGAMNLRTSGLIAAFALAGLLVTEAANAQVIIMTSRPGGDTIDWRQINVVSGSNNPFPTPLPFESFNGIQGTAGRKGDLLYLWRQCCCANDGTYDGNFNQGDYLILSGTPAQIILNFKTPVKSVGAQVASNQYGSYVAQIQAFNNKRLLGTFTENGNLTTLADGSAIFLGIQDTIAEITDIVYTVTNNGSQGTVVIDRVSVSQ
jgi:hypothetical protein